jgi:hypothetical protein
VCSSDLANTRKGSRVVIGVVSSQYFKITGKVGRIVKKRDKDVVVQFGQIVTAIPYPDLKPASQSTAKERKENAKRSEADHKVVRELNKVIGRLG